MTLLLALLCAGAIGILIAAFKVKRNMDDFMRGPEWRIKQSAVRWDMRARR